MLLRPPLSVLLLGTISLTPSLARLSADTGPAPAEVTIVASDFSFDVPDRIPAGAVTLRLVNKGTELHHAQLVQLRDGKTPEDIGMAMEQAHMPDFVTWIGGPGLAAPGGESNVTLVLRPGTYYILCFVENADGPHAMQGMVKEIQVEGGAGGDLPAADNLIRLSDYDFDIGRQLTAGTHTIRVRNYAGQPHEVQIVKLMPGKTLDDLVQWMAAGAQGQPPAMPVGGAQGMDEGRAVNISVTLEPGEYGLICFIPDVTDFQPHFAHGMMKQITVS